MNVVILAAGKGKRMKSDIPKVLHELAGKPLLGWVLDTVSSLSPEKTIVVIGFKRELVEKYIKSRKDSSKITTVIQTELLGTADAVRRALPKLPDDGLLVVLCGDVPLLTAKTIKKLIDHHENTNAAATILTAVLEDPAQYGRIVRTKDGDVEKIVEFKDATDAQRKIKEINTGTYVFNLKPLREVINLVSADNAQREYYLTDVIHLLRGRGYKVSALPAEDVWEVAGVNSKEQLERLEKHVRAKVKK